MAGEQLTAREMEILARAISDALLGRWSLGLADSITLKGIGARAKTDRRYVVAALKTWIQEDPRARLHIRAACAELGIT